MGERTAWKLRAPAGWFSSPSKQCGSGKKAGPPVHDDLTAIEGKHGEPLHDVTTASSGINQLWVGDITGHWTGEEKLYMRALKDARSRKIVGYSIGERIPASLTVDALNNAVAMRGSVRGYIVHTDRESRS